MIKRFLLALIVLALIFGGLFGYKAYVGYKMGKMMAAFKFPPAAVSIAAAESGDWHPYVHAVGNISSPQTVNVTTQVAGQVSRIYFHSGEFVEKGQPLIDLDDSTQAAQLRQYEAQLIINKFNYSQYKKAYLKNAVSKASYVQTLSALKQNEALIGQTKTIINDMHIKAPFSGRLGIRDASMVNLGQYINLGANIISLYSVNPVYADFTLPQNYIGKLKIGQGIKIRSDSFPDRTFIGKIKAISIDVNNLSRNITVRAEVPNNGLLLRPGMFVTGNILMPVLHNVVTIPATAVTYNPYGDFVYVAVKKGGGFTAETRYISVGEERSGRVVVLKGIKAGEIVVTAGQVRLRNGAAIVFKTPEKTSRLKPRQAGA